MELSFNTLSLLTAILLTGLSAGLFYAWEVSVIPGTRQIPDHGYLEAMQSINRAILNPAFYLIFFGSLLFLFLSTYLQFMAGARLSAYFLLAAMLTYLIGTVGITVFGNVPMNESLDAVHLQELSSQSLHELRTAYEGKWNQWHRLRTIFAVLAFVLSIVSAFMADPIK